MPGKQLLQKLQLSVTSQWVRVHRQFVSQPTQDENGDTGSSSSLPSAREKPKRPSRSFLRRKDSIKKRDYERKLVPKNISVVTQHQSPSGLHDTPDASLPGQTTNKCRIAKDVAWMSHTICRSNISQKATPHKPHRACLYLEDYQLTWEIPKLTNQNNCLRKEDRVVHLPFDHKPGTFPKSLSIESLCPLSVSQSPYHIDWAGEDGDLSLDGSISRSGSQDCLSGFGRRRNSLNSIGSIYDNVPETPGSPCDILTLEKKKPSRIWMTFYSTYMGYSTTSMNGRGHSAFNRRTNQMRRTESMADTLPCSLNYDEQSMSDVGTTVSDYDSPGNSVNEEEEGMRERRDSGVGASLTRPSRWVKLVVRVYWKFWPVHTALSAISTYLDKEFLDTQFVFWYTVWRQWQLCVPWKPTCSSSVFGDFFLSIIFKYNSTSCKLITNED